MADYTPQIDSQISQMLKVRAGVTADMISGVSEEEARGFLQLYVKNHPDEPLSFDGTTLTTGFASLAEGTAASSVITGMPLDSGPGSAAPMPQAYAPPPPGADVPPTYGAPPPGGYGTPGYVPDLPALSEPSGWLWLLPILFGWIGGIIAWAVAKDKNSAVARNMLITGIAITVISACLGFGLGILGGGAMSAAPTDTTWPGTQKVTFYYFGTPS